MKKGLYFIILMFILAGCQKDHHIIGTDTGTAIIESLRADFEQQTGYDELDSNFVNSSFKSVIDWKTYRQLSNDTIYVKVNVLDQVELVWDSTRIDIKDNVWLKAINKDKKWGYQLLTFIKGDKQKNYSGAIASQSLKDRVTKISFFLNDEKLDRNSNKLVAGFPPMRQPNCVQGYVEGYLNTVVCEGSGGDDPGSYEDWLAGTPGDYNNVTPGGSPGGGGGHNSSTITVKKLSKNDPCGNKTELNNRKKDPGIAAKNTEIKNLTLQTGKEHGYNAFVNLTSGKVTNFTEVEVGYEQEGGVQEVTSQEAWHWGTNDDVEVTVDYTHTHPFKSGPTSIDIFSGIGVYMATSNGSMDALSAAQKEVYLSYHSINVMTTNNDYAITITDPAKWVSRYANREADFNKFQDLAKRYKKLGYDVHTAQEIALLDLYGDMIQLYRSDVGAANFEPVSAKVDPNTLKKVISNINCN